MLKSNLFALAMCFCLAVATCFVSNNLNGRFQHREETIKEQLGIISVTPWEYDGIETYYFEFQNRILFAAALKGISSLGVLKTSQAYLLLRFATCLAGYFVFWKLLEGITANRKAAMAGVGVLFYVLVLSCNHPWEHPTDYPDIIFISLYLACVLRRAGLLLIPLVILGSCNRESSPFAGVMWFFLYGFTDDKKLRVRETFFAGTLCILGYVSVTAVRYMMGGQQAAAPQTVSILYLASYIREVVHSPSLTSWPILLACLFTPALLWLWANRERVHSFHIRLLAMGLVLAGITAVFSNLREMRAFIPAAIVFIFAAAAAETGINYLQQPLRGAQTEPGTPTRVGIARNRPFLSASRKDS
ncbi:MAG: hypothetical protein ACJ8FY_01860 [Gemmataceae bacterium]